MRNRTAKNDTTIKSHCHPTTGTPLSSAMTRHIDRPNFQDNNDSDERSAEDHEHEPAETGGHLCNVLVIEIRIHGTHSHSKRHDPEDSEKHGERGNAPS